MAMSGDGVLDRRRAPLDASRSTVLHTALGPIEYAATGPPGRVVLLVHGQPGGYDQGLIVGRPLAAGARLVAPSRPGYLGTPLAGRVTAAQQADLLASMLDALGVEKAGVVGFSAGGLPALALALRYPARVSALVMLSAVSGRVPHAGAVMHRIGMSPPLVVTAGLAGRLAPILLAAGTLVVAGSNGPRTTARQARFAAADPAAREALLGLMSTIGPGSARGEGFRNDLGFLGDDAPVPLEDVAAPVLVVHGLRDREVSPSHAQRVLIRAPRARALYVDDGTHVLQVHPAWPAVAARAARFLERHGA